MTPAATRRRSDRGDDEPTGAAAGEEAGASAGEEAGASAGEAAGDEAARCPIAGVATTGIYVSGRISERALRQGRVDGATG